MKLSELCGNLQNAQDHYIKCASCGKIVKKAGSGSDVCPSCGRPSLVNQIQPGDMGKEV